MSAGAGVRQRDYALRWQILSTAACERPTDSAMTRSECSARARRMAASRRSVHVRACSAASAASTSGSGTDGTAELAALLPAGTEDLAVPFGALLPLGFAGIAGTAEVVGVRGSGGARRATGHVYIVDTPIPGVNKVDR